MIEDPLSDQRGPTVGPRTGPLLSALVGIAMVLTACGGQAPSSTIGPSAALATQGPSSAAPATSPAGSAVGTLPPPTSGASTTTTPPPGPVSAFTLLKMATAADPSKSAPDPTTFTVTFGPKAPTLYVVFALRPGLAGDVVATITTNGTPVVKPITIAYRTTNTWGDFKITSLGRFVVGDYQATITFTSTGESLTTNFTVK